MGGVAAGAESELVPALPAVLKGKGRAKTATAEHVAATETYPCA